MYPKLLLLPLFALLLAGFAPAGDKTLFPEHLRHTCIARLKEVDSLSYYQCYVATTDGTPVNSARKNNCITLTEKYKLYKNGNEYRLKSYTSTAADYPNKKYAYLKLAEKGYWNFRLKQDTLLPLQDVLLLAAYETKLMEVTEYDFTVNKNSAPQLILNGRKISAQYRVSGGYLLKNTLSVLKQQQGQ